MSRHRNTNARPSRSSREAVVRADAAFLYVYQGAVRTRGGGRRTYVFQWGNVRGLDAAYRAVTSGRSNAS